MRERLPLVVPGHVREELLDIVRLDIFVLEDVLKRALVHLPLDHHALLSGHLHTQS